MTYETALVKLYETVPGGIRLGLDRVRRAAAALGHPEKGLRAVQVAGTNGKGSVAKMVAHGAQAAGLHTGLYTSPHLHCFAERIQINGKPADADRLGDHLERVLDLARHAPAGPLTFFEIATLAALLHFDEQEVDLAVLEVGLGGRLDATSIVTPEVTAITSIGLDHTELLGSTLAAVAGEKAAIARPGVPLVIGALPGEALEKVVEIAGEKGAPLRILGRDFQVEDGLKLSLAGVHQRRNAAVAQDIYARLGRADARFDPDVFRDALSRVEWPGRFEILSLGREFILDGAHNLEATEALVTSLRTLNKPPGILLYGALAGKPIPEMLALLSGHAGQRVFVPPPISRAWAPGDYAAPGDRVARTVAEGLALIDDISDEDTTVLVTGSLFTVAEARRLLLKLPADPPVGL